MNMKKWVEDTIASPVKKALPVLSFPAIQLMGITVRDLISSSDMQSRGMKIIADRVDAAASVSLMDLSVEAEAFGSEIRFSDVEVPTVTGHILSNSEDVKNLKIPEVGAGRTGIYVESIKKALELIKDKPVFGGTIGPYSLAGRLFDVSEIMMFCYDDPDAANLLLEKSSDFIISYMKEYKKIGANGVIMAEPLTGMLSPAMAEEFSAPHIKRIVDAVQDDEFMVIYHNCGNNTVKMADSIASTGAMGYHFGNAINMEDILPLMPADALILGNVSPAEQFKNGTVESIREKTNNILKNCSEYPNFIISSGCDIPPVSKWENIDEFFRTAENFYK